MSVITLHLHDRFGNNLSQYAMARGYAERHGCQLQTTPWVGQQIFEIDDPPIDRELPKRYDMDIDQWNGETDIDITGWGLHQKCLLYTRTDARRWFKFRTEIEKELAYIQQRELVGHLRERDFVSMEDYIAVSHMSYIDTCEQFGIDFVEFYFVSENLALSRAPFPVTGLDFLGDFYTMMRAKILFRSNSTFSYWAAVLGNAERVFSPKLDGIKPIAGVMQDVPFVEGNHCAISCVHPNCSDLHLSP